MVIACLIDGAFNAGIEKALYRWVESIEGDQDADFFAAELLGCPLERIQRRALALG